MREAGDKIACPTRNLKTRGAGGLAAGVFFARENDFGGHAIGEVGVGGVFVCNGGWVDFGSAAVAAVGQVGGDGLVAGCNSGRLVADGAL